MCSPLAPRLSSFARRKSSLADTAARDCGESGQSTAECAQWVDLTVHTALVLPHALLLLTGDVDDRQGFRRQGCGSFAARSRLRQDGNR